MIVVRYADDFVTGFEFEEDAVRFLAGLKERLAKFALELHGGRTRLIEFGRFAAERRKKRGEGKPETFDFLGFTHICGRTRSGKFQILRRRMAKRQTAKLKALGEELKIRRQQSIAQQGKWLGAVLRGYYGYHAVPGNLQSVGNASVTNCPIAGTAACADGATRSVWTGAKCSSMSGAGSHLPGPIIPIPTIVSMNANTQGRSPVR